jgi:hypothetical protein
VRAIARTSSCILSRAGTFSVPCWRNVRIGCAMRHLLQQIGAR